MGLIALIALVALASRVHAWLLFKNEGWIWEKKWRAVIDPAADWSTIQWAMRDAVGEASTHLGCATAILFFYICGGIGNGVSWLAEGRSLLIALSFHNLAMLIFGHTAMACKFASLIKIRPSASDKDIPNQK